MYYIAYKYVLKVDHMQYFLYNFRELEGLLEKEVSLVCLETK